MSGFHRSGAYLGNDLKTVLLVRTLLPKSVGAVPFKVIDERQVAMFAGQYEHVVIDTEARPEYKDLKALTELSSISASTPPDALSLEALTLIVDALKKQGTNRFKVLLSIVPPKPEQDGEEAREALTEAGLLYFKTEIRRYAAYKKAASTLEPNEAIPIFAKLRRIVGMKLITRFACRCCQMEIGAIFQN